MKLDPHAVFESITTQSAGWRPGRVVFVNGPRRPFEGLIAPDGTAFECFDVPDKPSAQRDMAKRIRSQGTAGYTQALVTVDGKQYLAERYRDNVKPWDGLDIIGEWSDDLCGIPSQCWVRGVFRGVPIVLYLRWRWHDPWTGVVIKSVSEDGRFYLDPWSPNLLPTDEPKPLHGTDFLSLLDMPKYDPWICEDELKRAKSTLIERGDAWLCKHVNDDAAWDR